MTSPDQPINRQPGSILYVCGMNAIRSPMAEFITKKMFGQEIFVQSAGVLASNLDGFMLQAMSEIGIDMSNHKPIMLKNLEDSFFDLVITLSPQAHHHCLDWASYQAVEVEYWPTMDPSTIAGSRQQVSDAYRATRDSLEKRIRNRFEKK